MANTSNYTTILSIISIYSPLFRDAGIAIECSGGAYIYISDDIGWIVIVAVHGLGTSRGAGVIGLCVILGIGLVTRD